MKFDPQNTLFLIDGSSFLYRAYYGLKPLHTLSGQPVQAVFGFCRMIKKLIDTYNPRHCGLVWDSKGKTVRHEMFAEYKATRQAPPSDIFEQKKYIIEFAHLIGLKQFEQSGLEADDIMYSLAKEWAQAGGAVIFVTLDKDMAQALLLNHQIYLFDAFKDQFFDRAAIESKMGFPIEKMPFYYALVGDTSDNIPGVKGVGQKTAVDLVNQFDSLDDMYARLSEVKKAGVKTALLTYRNNAFLSRELFLLQYHPTNAERESLHFDAQGWAHARSLFEQLNFKSLLADMGQSKQQMFEKVQHKIEYWQQYNFIVVQTIEQLNGMCEYLKQQGAFAVDTETTGLDALSVTLVGLSFCASEDIAYYVPCGHTTGENQLSSNIVLDAVRDLLENPLYKKYLHNVKYDELVLSSYGVALHGVVMDTMIAAHLVMQEGQGVSLKKLSHHFFKQEMVTYEEVVKEQKYKDFSCVPLALASLYSCADSYQTFRLASALQGEFDSAPSLKKLYYMIEHPLIGVLCDMEKEGVCIDVDMLRRLDDKVIADLMSIEESILALIGNESINLNSPRQVEDLLFNKLQLPPQKKSPTGKLSTDQEVLVALAKLNPVPGLIIKYRELTKLKSTYIDALPHYINKKTGRIHTTFSQTAVATGRLASSNPNLQNIPTDSQGYGIEVRESFHPPVGHIFVSADYSQIELRVLAYLSQDETLCNAFLHNKDIHSETAARLFDVALEDITHEQRQLGKRINFSVLYGLTPYGLSKDLGIPFKDAKLYIERYFAQYPGVSNWMNTVIESVKNLGYVETLWGRRRYISAIYERNRSMYEEACRIAVNTVVQGTAAEIMKLGMIALFIELQKYTDAKIVLQIHDELLISVPESLSVVVEQEAKRVLEGIVNWNIPLIVSTRIGHNWKEVTK